MSIKNALATDPKVGASVATATAGSGLGTVLEWIPTDIGKLATLVGIVLSCVLIYTHLRKGRVEYEKTRLEIEILKKRALADAQHPGGVSGDDEKGAAHR